ncbi:MAG: hypothetical protein MPJ50_01075 [Pirellulales bacterium]|nr:hypothetical protein [Pirellulales bacterium]
MRRLVSKFFIAIFLLTSASPAVAGNWIFAQSYYSHTPIHPVKIGTPTSSRSIAPQYFRAYVQGGYRYTGGSYNLRSNQFGFDRYFESWGQGGPHN